MTATALALLALLQAPEERFTLENGLSVILRPVPGAGQAAVVMLFSVGGDHDPEGRSGLAHLLEHLYCTAPAAATPRRTVEEAFRRYPAGFNGQTGERYTVIATVVPKARLEEELRDAAARMGDLRIDAEDLERERPRLIQEVHNMFGAIPMLARGNLAWEFLRPTPRGGRRGGLPGHVQAITVDDLRDWWRRLYKPRNAILSVAGGFEVATARELVKRHFAGLPAGEAPPEPGRSGTPRLGMLERVRVKPIQPGLGPEFAVAWTTPGPGSPDYAPFLVIVARMWDRAAKEKNSLLAGFTPIDDPTKITIGVPIAAGDAPEKALERAEAFVADAARDALAPSDLAATRRAFALIGLEPMPPMALAMNPYAAAFSSGRRAQLGLDPAAVRRSLDDLRDEDLKRAAKEVFAPSRRAAVLVIPEP